MNPALKLQRQIEEKEVAHPAFDAQFEFLSMRMEAALQGFAPRIEWVVGPSRVGKTMLINRLARLHPETKERGKRHVPVLVVPLPAGVSPQQLPGSVLEALRVPLPLRGAKTGELSKRMKEQLRLARNRVLIFEEASHLVEPGAKVIPRAAGDWFKSLSETEDVTIFMFGVPRLHRLFDSNEQLKLRASARREFRPYDSRNPSELRAFAACVKAYAEIFKRAAYPIAVADAALVAQCYLLSGGLIGVLSRFMQELASQFAYHSPRPVTWEDCQMVSTCVEPAGDPNWPAFMNFKGTATELQAAHAYALHMNGMAPRLVLPAAGPAQ